MNSEGTIAISIIAAPRKTRFCHRCNKLIMAGTPTLRMFGRASSSDPLQLIYMHLECAKESNSPELKAYFAESHS